jgi:stage IV sporulation protein FB
VFGAELQAAAAKSVDNAAIPLVNRLAAVNLFIALFNMIPAFPMDGGRVLRSALAARLGYVRATGIAASIGQFVAFALGFIGLMANPILIFIAIFVYLAASSEAHMVALRAVSRGVPVTHAMVTQFATLTPEAHIDEAVQTLLATSQGEFPVVDGAGKPVGLLGRGDIIRAIKTLGPGARVADAMAAGMPTIGHRRSLEEAFKLLQEKQTAAVAVTDASGALAGLVTSETIAEMMMLQDALPRGSSLGPWGRPAGA